MAIAFVNAGASGTGTTTADLPYPASIVAGRLLVACVVTKYPPNNPSTPSLFTLNGNTTGGAGSAGVDSGTIDVRVFTKIADGTETGNLTVSNASANAIVGRILQLSKAAAKNWGLLSGIGSQNSATTNWSIATSLSDIGLGDVVIAAAGVNSNQNTYSAETITATGLTVGTETERTDQGSAQGDDLHLVISSHESITGTASSNATFAMTASGSAGNQPAGAVVLLRLREVDINIDPSGIATAEAFGSPSTASIIDASGIASAEAFGTPVLSQFIVPSGIASTEAFGTPDAGLILAPTGIASLEAFGTPVLSSFIVPSAIASLEAFGTPVLSSFIDVSGIASAEAFGTAVVAHAIVIDPSGIASAEAFGTPVLSQFIAPSGIASAEAFGSPDAGLILSPSAIASLEAFGTPSFLFVIAPTGIASAEVVPSPTLLDAISPSGIASAEAFGTALLEMSGVISPLGIASAEAFGTAEVDTGALLQRLFATTFSTVGFSRSLTSSVEFSRMTSGTAEID